MQQELAGSRLRGNPAVLQVAGCRLQVAGLQACRLAGLQACRLAGLRGYGNQYKRIMDCNILFQEFSCKLFRGCRFRQARPSLSQTSNFRCRFRGRKLANFKLEYRSALWNRHFQIATSARKLAPVAANCDHLANFDTVLITLAGKIQRKSDGPSDESAKQLELPHIDFTIPMLGGII